MTTSLQADTGAPERQPTDAERLRAKAQDALAEAKGNIEEAMDAFQAEVELDVDLVIACVGEEVYRRACLNELRLAKTSQDARELKGIGPKPRGKADQARIDGKAKVGTAALGMLSSYYVGDRPLGVCTKAELEAAAKVDRKHAGFKDALAKLLPKADSVVAQHVTAHAVAEVWKKAAA